MAADLEADLERVIAGVDEEQRERLRTLLGRLREAGAGPAELIEAVEGRRLGLLAAERALAGGERYSAAEVAERVGVPIEVLQAQWRALGMVVADPEEPNLTRADLDAAERIREMLATGISPEALEQSARVMAMALAQVAASHREVATELVVEAGSDAQGAGDEVRSLGEELDVAEQLEGLTRTLVPLVGPALEHLYRVQLREQLRHAVIDAEVRRRTNSADVTAVAFADLVGFTKLGEQLPPEQFGEITVRFAALAAEVAGGPVRLVKMIGDAAMFAAPEPAALAAATLELLELVEEQEEDFPGGLRAGLAWGPAISRGGDLYGRSVNLASRLVGAARPGSLLCAGEDPAEALGEGFRLSDAGHKRLKGIGGGQQVYRVRWAPDEQADTDEEEDPEVSSGRRGPRRRRARRS